MATDDIVLIVVGLVVVGFWIWALVISRRHKEQQSLDSRGQGDVSRPAGDQERDIALVREQEINLMNAAQLSEAQTADKAPFQICVFAPDPLELHSEEVYRSTLAWVKRHIHEVRTSDAAPELTQETPSMVFWCRASEAVPRVLEIVSRLHAALKGDDRVLELIACVRAPDYLFFVDMTLHRYRDDDIRAYVNARDEKGVTNLLVELPKSHAQHVDAMLGRWLEQAIMSTLYFRATGAGFRGLESRQTVQKRTSSIRCWTIESRHLELRPALEAVEDMFQPQKNVELKIVSSRDDV